MGPFEKVARAICLAQGDDPDAMTHYGSDLIKSLTIPIPLWQHYCHAAHQAIEAVGLVPEPEKETWYKTLEERV